jgi:hydroxyacylglutathione hydrolase
LFWDGGCLQGMQVGKSHWEDARRTFVISEWGGDRKCPVQGWTRCTFHLCRVLSPQACLRAAERDKISAMDCLAPDVWQISTAPLHGLNVHLVGDVLIDSGTRWNRRRLLRELARVRVGMVALSHCHPDHQGSAKAVCEAHACPLACHAGDRAAAEGCEPMTPPGRIIRFLSNILAGPHSPVDRVLRDGDDIAGFRVVEAPGHTPGHIVFFREVDRVAIVGDLARNVDFLTGRVGLAEPPSYFSVDPAMNRRSLRAVAELRPELVLFSHGPPLRDGGVLQRFASRFAAS